MTQHTAVHNQTGVHVDPRDPRLVANEIQELCENPERLKTMGQAAKNHVLSQYSFEQEALEYERLYTAILKKRER